MISIFAKDLGIASIQKFYLQFLSLSSILSLPKLERILSLFFFVSIVVVVSVVRT